MGLIFSTTGRPSTVCPNCGTMKAIDKKRNFEKETLRAKCPKCKTSWNLTPEEAEKVRNYFSVKKTHGRPATQKKEHEQQKQDQHHKQEPPAKKHTSIWDRLI